MTASFKDTPVNLIGMRFGERAVVYSAFYLFPSGTAK
jgi:hypothetical protein